MLENLARNLGERLGIVSAPVPEPHSRDTTIGEIVIRSFETSEFTREEYSRRGIRPSPSMLMDTRYELAFQSGDLSETILYAQRIGYIPNTFEQTVNDGNNGHLRLYHKNDGSETPSARIVFENRKFRLYKSAEKFFTPPGTEAQLNLPLVPEGAIKPFEIGSSRHSKDNMQFPNLSNIFESVDLLAVILHARDLGYRTTAIYQAPHNLGARAYIELQKEGQTNKGMITSEWLGHPMYVMYVPKIHIM